MKRALFLVFLQILLLQLHAAAKEPKGHITLKLDHLMGHELGYGRPQEGSSLKFRLAELPKVDKLDFKGKNSFEYIPLPGKFQFEDVEWNGDTWDSLRARATRGTHIVTLDLQKVGASSDVICFITIESNKRVVGCAHLKGKYK